MINPFHSGLWPPSTPQWAVFFLVVCALIGLLGFVRRGRLLRGATVLVVVGLPVVVLARSDAGRGLVVLLWLLAVSATLGDLGCRALRLGEKSAGSCAEWLGLRTLVGFGVLSCLAGFMAHFGALNPLISVGFSAACTLPVLRYARRLSGLLRTAAWNPLQPAATDPRWTSIAWALMVFLLLFPFLWALAPAVQWDSLSGHLPFSYAYTTPESFSRVASYFGAYVPGQVYMLYALGFTLGGQPLPGLLSFVFCAITAALIFALASRLAGRVAAWIAAIAFVSLPCVAWDAGSAYLDVFVTGFTFGNAYVVFRWREDRNVRWLGLAGFLGGLAIASKASALFLILPTVAYVIYSFIRSGPRNQLTAGLLLQLVPILAIPAPWFIRNWLWAGSPVYPLKSSLFHATLPTPGFNWEFFGVGKGLVYFLRLPYDLVFHGNKFDECGVFIYGLVPLVAFMSLFIGGKKLWNEGRALLLGLAVCGFATWYSVGQVGRYLMPVVPLLVVIMVLPVPTLMARMRSPSIYAALLVLSLAYLAYSRSVGTVWNYNIPDGYPYRYALGLESHRQFLERALRPYAAFEYINRHSTAGSRVIAPNGEIRFYLDVPLDDPIFSTNVGPLIKAASNRALYNELAKRGYEYVLLDRDVVKSPSSFPYTNPLFLAQFARIVFSKANVDVYKLTEESGGSEPARELLQNGGFDTIEAGAPVEWAKFGNPKIIVDQKRAYSPPAFVAVTQDDGFCQRTTVTPGNTYLVRIRARADAPGQSAWLQILWFNAGMKIVDTTITAVSVTSDWKQYEAPMTAANPQAAYGQVYARAAAGNRVDIDDVSLTEIGR